MSEDIDRLLSKIRILEDMIKNGKHTVIAKDDPDFPDGLEFTFPKTWKAQLKSTVRTLKRQLKAKVNAYTSG